MTLPFVSIILPIRNEAVYIRRALASVLAQDYPAGCMEVLVIDGMSTDDTRQVVGQFAGADAKFPVRLLDNPAGIAPKALNIGLNEAKGDIIIRVDGHCEIAPDYVRICVLHLQEDGVDGVGGVMETVGNTYMERVIALAMSTPFGVGHSAFRTLKTAHFFTDSVPFPAYTKEMIQRAGCFDETMLCNEDDEYNFRLRALGAKIRLTSDLHSKYYCRGSLIAFWKQYYRYGFWKVRVWQKHPRQMHIRHFIPMAFVSLLLIAAVLAMVFPMGWIALALILGFYLLVNLAASVWATANNDWRLFFLLPASYSVLHLSYGFGYLGGVIKFWNHWRD